MSGLWDFTCEQLVIVGMRLGLGLGPGVRIMGLYL